MKFEYAQGGTMEEVSNEEKKIPCPLARVIAPVWYGVLHSFIHLCVSLFKALGLKYWICKKSAISQGLSRYNEGMLW